MPGCGLIETTVADRDLEATERRGRGREHWVVLVGKERHSLLGVMGVEFNALWV